MQPAVFRLGHRQVTWSEVKQNECMAVLTHRYLTIFMTFIHQKQQHAYYKLVSQKFRKFKNIRNVTNSSLITLLITIVVSLHQKIYNSIH